MFKMYDLFLICYVCSYVHMFYTCLTIFMIFLVSYILYVPYVPYVLCLPYLICSMVLGTSDRGHVRDGEGGDQSESAAHIRMVGHIPPLPLPARNSGLLFLDPARTFRQREPIRNLRFNLRDLAAVVEVEEKHSPSLVMMRSNGVANMIIGYNKN